MKRYLEAGRLGAPRGIRGELKLNVWCDDAYFLEGIERFYLVDNGEKPLEVALYRASIPSVIFKGYEDRTKAAALTNRIIYFDRNDVQLDEGSFFNDDLIGLPVYDDITDSIIGTLEAIDESAAGFLYKVKGEGKSYTIPFNREFITELSLELIKAHVIEGLEDTDGK